jgi:hypothetical protein
MRGGEGVEILKSEGKWMVQGKYKRVSPNDQTPYRTTTNKQAF